MVVRRLEILLLFFFFKIFNLKRILWEAILKDIFQPFSFLFFKVCFQLKKGKGINGRHKETISSTTFRFSYKGSM